MKQFLYVLATLLVLSLDLKAQAQRAESTDYDAPSLALASDSLEVSLLTCAPGQEVYAFYGHTALRVRSVTEDGGKDNPFDMVFNYGAFDFDAPGFTYRFVRGETDYFLSAAPTSLFLYAYQRMGRSVREQVLDLTQAEAHAAAGDLLRIAQRPDWTYRYNFLYDNCTTRALSTIECATVGRIVWPADSAQHTLRSIIRQYATPASPWSAFGQDLLLGAEIDAPASVQTQLFAPLYAARYCERALLVDSAGGKRPLVRADHMLLEVTPHPARHAALSPMWAMMALLGAALGLCGFEWRRQRMVHLFDSALALIQGLAGTLVVTLYLASAHPAVDSNWCILLLNPLPLLYLPIKIARERRGLPTAHHEMEAMLSIVFLISALAGVQQYPPAVYPFVTALLVRAVSALALHRHLKAEA